MKLIFLFLLCLSASASDLLLVLQRDLPIASACYIDTWKAQVEAEGYDVTVAFGPRANLKDTNQVLTFAKSTVWPWVRQHPGGYVFLVGDLPMPRTGLSINPDGHAGSAGAYSSTVFYGCPSDQWTDEGDNRGYLPRTQLLNMPGDGKFDQQAGPGSLGAFSVGPLLAKVGFYNPYANPKTFGSPLDSVDYTIDSLKRYFDLNVRWRSGEIDVTKVAAGVDRSPQNAGVVSFLVNNFGESNVIQFTRASSPFLGGPRLFQNDMKGLSESNAYWSTLADGNLNCVLDLNFGSLQIDYRTGRTFNPMNCGYLAVGNMGRTWNMDGWKTKTIGELWFQTVNSPSAMTHIILYGDPTLRLSLQ